MSGRCLCGGVTYSTWRLDTLRKLCAPHLAGTRPQLSFLYPPSRNRRYAGDTANDGGESKTSDTGERPPVRRVRSSKIDVSSADAVKDMKDLMSTLKAFAEDSSHATLPEAPNMEHKPILTHRPIPPQSPIFDFLESTKRKRSLRERKPRAPGPNMLAYDPWASMLADPIRMCPATGMRLPKALLTQWGLVRHPETQDDVYLLPTELADVEQLKSMGERLQKQRQDAKDAKSRPPTHDDGVSSEHPLFSNNEATYGGNILLDHPIQSARDDRAQTSLPEAKNHALSTPAAIRLLPHLNLLKQLTLNLTSLDPRRGQLLTRPNIVSRLLPTVLKMRLAEFNHYLKQRRQVERQTGVISRKPIPYGKEVALPLLNWQSSVTGRVLGLMRRRVVIAVKRILELEAGRLERRRVQVFGEGYLKGEEEAAPPETLTELGSTPAHGGSGKAIDQAVEDQAVIADTPRLTGEAKAQADQVQRSNFLKEIQSRAFLHFGPYPSPIIDSITKSCATPLNPAAATAYLPPMLQSQDNAQMFPYFPLLPLLGPELHEDLQAVVLQHVRDKQILARGTLDHDASSAQSFALMVKVTAWHANSLIRELWRLWRYVGGREALELLAAGIDMGSDAVVGDPRATAQQGAAAAVVKAAAGKGKATPVASEPAVAAGADEPAAADMKTTRTPVESKPSVTTEPNEPTAAPAETRAAAPAPPASNGALAPVIKAAAASRKTIPSYSKAADALWGPPESRTRKISRWERRKAGEAVRGEAVAEG